MQAHIIEPPERRTPATDVTPDGPDVATVGTFASGQAVQGSFHVATEAEVGSFADGDTAEQASESV